VHVISVNLQSEPEDEVVEDRKESGSSKTVVGEHIRHHSDLVVDGGIRPEEEAQLFGDRSQPPPINEGIEEKLIAS
jgi:hypothetical protein